MTETPTQDGRQFDRIYLWADDYETDGDGPVLWSTENSGDAEDAVEYVNVAAYDAQVKRNEELEADCFEAAQLLDCRAGRLLLKGAAFLVVRDDEPYHAITYARIREREREIGRWSDEDEANYQRARVAAYERKRKEAHDA